MDYGGRYALPQNASGTRAAGQVSPNTRPRTYEWNASRTPVEMCCTCLYAEGMSKTITASAPLRSRLAVEACALWTKSCEKHKITRLEH